MSDTDTAADLLPHQLPENRGRYSLARAVRALSDRKARRLDGLEGEVSQELARRYDRTAVETPNGDRSFFLPWDAEVRDVTTSTAAGGIASIVGRPLIDVLRARTVVSRLGAVTLPDVPPGSSFSLPKRTATVTLTYTAEGVAPASSGQTLGSQMTIAPSTVGAYTDASRKFYKTIGEGYGQDLVTGDALTAIGVEVDRAALNGSGAAGLPLGLLQGAAGSSYSFGTNGAAPTWADLCEMERIIADANAQLGPLGFVTSPKGRSKLRRTFTDTTGGRSLWKADGTLATGAMAEATTICPSTCVHGSGTGLSASVMGDFSQLVLAFWGPPTIVINPFVNGSTGAVRTTVLVDYGVNVRHAESFIASGDMVTT